MFIKCAHCHTPTLWLQMVFLNGTSPPQPPVPLKLLYARIYSRYYIHYCSRDINDCLGSRNEIIQKILLEEKKKKTIVSTSLGTKETVQLGEIQSPGTTIARDHMMGGLLVLQLRCRTLAPSHHASKKLDNTVIHLQTELGYRCSETFLSAVEKVVIIIISAIRRPLLLNIDLPQLEKVVQDVYIYPRARVAARGPRRLQHTPPRRAVSTFCASVWRVTWSACPTLLHIGQSAPLHNSHNRPPLLAPRKFVPLFQYFNTA
uniref:SFRICE_031507 n=1 Tax=Spodoptera frugiperda TaxID=7108 RepID=A0A2H1WFX4_SPOFR